MRVLLKQTCSGLQMSASQVGAITRITRQAQDKLHEAISFSGEDGFVVYGSSQ